MKKISVVGLVAISTVLGVGTSEAQNVCVPQGHGVPFDGGPPIWMDYNGGVAPVGTIKETYDDPRWRGALGLSYTTGSATAGSANPPVQFRALWGRDDSNSGSTTSGGYGTNRFLYLQWIVRVGTWGRRRGSQDLVVAFERPDQASLAAGAKRGFILRFHLGDPATVAPGQDISRSLSQCVTGPSTACPDTSDYVEVYERTIATASASADTTCGIFQDSLHYEFSSTAIPWLTRATQYERRCATSDPSTCEKWIISVRIPVITPNTAEARAAELGMEDGSKFSYELDVPLWDHDNDIGTTDLSGIVNHWPRLPDTATASPICIHSVGTGGPPIKTIDKDADDDSGPGPDSGPEPFSGIPLWNGDDASRTTLGCFGGWRLAYDKIGSLWRDATATAPTAATILSSPFQYTFKAEMSAGVRAANTVAAVPSNNGTACGDPTSIPPKPPCPAFRAHFRIAEWGAQPAGSNATFKPFRGSEGGVCGEAPSGGTPTVCGQISNVAATHAPLVSFDWTIGGTGADFNEALEYCQYGLTPPASYPWTCSNNCDLGGTCDPTTQTNCGVRAVPSGATAPSPCVRKLWGHQCMLVELESDSAADIEVASTYRNMNIVAMSETQQEATISTKGLAAIPGKKQEDIFLVVMPRNMPATLPAGTTGVSMVQQNAKAERDRMMRPYVEAAKQLSDEEYRDLAHRGYGGFGYGGTSFDPEIVVPPGQEFPSGDLPRGVDLMPRNVRAVAEFLDGVARYGGSAEDLTHGTLDVLDDVTAAELLPVMDVYAFRALRHGLAPMTSFSMVVHHEGPIHGVLWEIDGATRLGPNLFRLEMPNGHKKRIRIRAMAKETAGEKQRAGDKKWPCSSGGGGCCHRSRCTQSEPDMALNYGLPLFVVGAVVMGRRRRRKK